MELSKHTSPRRVSVLNALISGHQSRFDLPEAWQYNLV